MGAARDLGEREGAGRGVSGRGIFGIVAGEGAGDGGGSGAVAGGEAGRFLGGVAAGPGHVILALPVFGAGAGAVDPPLDEILGEGGQRMGDEHPQAGSGEASVAAGEAGRDRRRAQRPERRLVAQ